jgi:hypothetical protein
MEQNIPDYFMGGAMTSFMISVWSRTFQNFPELSLEHSRTDDIIPCRYNFVKHLVGQSILIENNTELIIQ